MQINQQLATFNRVLMDDINKKVVKTLSVRKLISSER